MMSSMLRILTTILALFVLGLIAISYSYGPSLDAPFYLDDVPNIVEASALHISALDSESLSGIFQGAHLTNRPVSNFSFALNYLHSGLDPRDFRLKAAGGEKVHATTAFAKALLYMKERVLDKISK